MGWFNSLTCVPAYSGLASTNKFQSKCCTYLRQGLLKTRSGLTFAWGFHWVFALTRGPLTVESQGSYLFLGLPKRVRVVVALSVKSRESN